MLPTEVLKAVAAGAGSRRIRFVGIHTAATLDEYKRAADLDVSAAAIRAFHMMPVAQYDEHGKLKPGTGGNGWRDIGYNFVVRKSGAVELGRPLAQIPAHIGGFNVESIGICFSGNGDVADFATAQYASGVSLVSALLDRFPYTTIEHVIGHREAPSFGAPPTPKTCPGTKVNMRAFRDRLVAARQYGPPPPPHISEPGA